MQPSDAHLPEQLALFDAAHISTLHSFCFKLIREHFHALGLDPQLTVLDEAQARLAADEILEEQFQGHYENGDPFSLAVQDLITVYGDGRDDTIRALVLRLHHYIQTRADAEAWLSRQIEEFSNAEPAQWREWYLKAVQEWRAEWVPILQGLRAENVKAAECLEILEQFPPDSAAIARSWSSLFRKLVGADRTESYPFRKKTVLRKPLEGFFDDAEFLGSLLPDAATLPPVNEEDSLSEDPLSSGNGTVCPAGAEAEQQSASIPKRETEALPALASQSSRVRKSSARQASVEQNLQLDLFIESALGKQSPGPGVQSAKTPAAPLIQQPGSPVIQSPVAPQLIEDNSPGAFAGRLGMEPWTHENAVADGEGVFGEILRA